MKELTTLYKRTKTGAIQEYQVSVVTDAITSGIIKLTGQLDGKKTRHEEWISEGKNIGKANETTPFQQACLQAESDWEKKRDEGYKSLEDLNIIDHGTHVAAHGQDLSLEEMLNTILPKFNTDASGQNKPMLAKAVDWKKVTYPCYIQPKLDGVRCLMVVRYDADKAVTFLSRSGKEYTTLNHISADIMRAENAIQKDFILDGEIYSDEITFQQIISAVKKQGPDSHKLHFRAYDIVNGDSQVERWKTVSDLVNDIDSERITLVKTVSIDSKDEAKLWHDHWVSEGNEGAMIRLYAGTYGQGQRSSALLKVKEFDETEFTFINFEFGQRQEDLIAVLSHGDKQFRAKMIGTVAEKEELYKLNESAADKQMTIKHFGYTDDGLPRFPIGKAFRDY